MTETCAIDLSYPHFYSTSIATGGLSALLLPFLIGARPDLENFAQNRFLRLFPDLTTIYTKSTKSREVIFGSLVVDFVFY